MMTCVSGIPARQYPGSNSEQEAETTLDGAHLKDVLKGFN